MVAAGQNGSAWVTGVLGTPLFPGTSQPLALVGDSFAVHVTSGNALDQTLRLGGQAVGSFTYGMLGSAPGAGAVNSDGSVVTFPATLTATITAGRASTQRFDLPLVAAPECRAPKQPSRSCGSMHCKRPVQRDGGLPDPGEHHQRGLRHFRFHPTLRPISSFVILGRPRPTDCH